MADLGRVLEAVVQRVLVMAARDSELRAHLRELAQAILEATAEPPCAVLVEEEAPRQEQPAPAAAPEESAQADGRAEPLPPPEQPAPARIGPLEPLLIGSQARPAADVHWPSRPSHAALAGEIDWELIEARCRLKAEGARWAVVRRRKLAEGAVFRQEIAPHDADMISRARELPDCFLWMNQPTGPSQVDAPLLEDVAGCFEAVADVSALVRLVTASLDNGQEVPRPVLELTAEAQSALRAAVLRVNGPTDRDQGQVFSWLRTVAEEQRTFIHRYMKLDDPADPTRWADIRARIAAARGQLESVRQLEKQRRKLFGKVGYHLKKIASGGEAEQQGNWQAITTAVDELVKAGVPPSSTEIRDLLLPVLDDMPDQDEPPRGFQLVLREIDRYLATRRPDTETASPAAPKEEVTRLAGLLAGKAAVLIGGDCRPHAKAALEEAFGLEELYWIETREHQTIEGFEPIIARPDVAVVLLAIKWSSHSYGEVRVFCERHGKPLVRLPGGYNPNQVAYQILSQCGERLAQSS
jgi:hypothetical protein